MGLFTRHTLALDRQLRPFGGRQSGNVIVCFLGGGGMMDGGAGARSIMAEFIQIPIEVFAHFIFHFGNVAAQRFEVVTSEGFFSSEQEGIAELVQRLLQFRGGECLIDSGFVLLVAFLLIVNSPSGQRIAPEQEEYAVFGPWTPIVKTRSISAVRLGPVM